MSAIAEVETVPDVIEATVNYVQNNGEKLFTYTGAPGGNDKRQGGSYDPRTVKMHNGRLETDRFVLDRDGFRFVGAPTKMRDFYDEDEIRSVYYPEMIELIKAESGAKRVVVFDHTLRTADDEMREAKKIREVVRRAHNDYTEWSGPQRVRDILPDEAEDLLTRRFAIVQVWRPIRLSGRDLPAGDLRRPQRRVRRLHHLRAHLSGPQGPDLRLRLQSQPPLVLVPAHAARGGAGVQGL